MSDNTCSNCCYKSDGWQAVPNYCYILDAEITDMLSTCDEWRGSLRDKPVDPPPLKESNYE